MWHWQGGGVARGVGVLGFGWMLATGLSGQAQGRGWTGVVQLSARLGCDNRVVKEGRRLCGWVVTS